MVKEKNSGNGKAAAVTAILIIAMIAASNSVGYIGNAIADASHSNMWILIAGFVALLSGIIAIAEGKEETS